MTRSLQGCLSRIMRRITNDFVWKRGRSACARKLTVFSTTTGEPQNQHDTRVVSPDRRSAHEHAEREHEENSPGDLLPHPLRIILLRHGESRNIRTESAMPEWKVLHTLPEWKVPLTSRGCAQVRPLPYSRFGFPCTQLCSASCGVRKRRHTT